MTMSRQIKKYIKTRCEKEKSNFKAEKINQEVYKRKNSFHIKIKKFFLKLHGFVQQRAVFGPLIRREKLADCRKCGGKYRQAADIESDLKNIKSIK